MLAQSATTRPETERYVHIYNIGTERRKVFNESSDYGVFTNYLKEYLSAPVDPSLVKTSFTVKGKTFKGTPHLPKNYHKQIHLLAYSLMPNHFHLLIKHTDRIALESFMRSLSTRYSMYFNKKYKRNGRLFRGAYKSVWVKTLPQVFYLTRYLHKENGRSSFPTYIDPSNEEWVSSSEIVSLFESIKDKTRNDLRSYQSFVEEAAVETEQSLTISGLTLEEETEALERSTIDSKDTPLEGNILSSNPAPKPRTNSKSSRKLAEYTAFTLWFVLLFSAGFLNVQINKTSTSTPQDTQVLALTISQTPEPSKSPIDEETSKTTDSDIGVQIPIQTHSPAPQVYDSLIALDSQEPENNHYSIVKVNIIEGTSLNIRQNPDSSSPIIAKANNKDTFKYVSEVEGWYEVKIDEFKSGFILAKLGIIEQNTN